MQVSRFLDLNNFLFDPRGSRKRETQTGYLDQSKKSGYLTVDHFEWDGKMCSPERYQSDKARI